MGRKWQPKEEQLRKGGRNGEKMATGGRTTLWWDMESCPLPSSSDPYIVTAMPSALLHIFGIINVKAGGCGLNPHDHFSAYEFFSPTERELDQTLINFGVRLHQLPPDPYIVTAMPSALLHRFGIINVKAEGSCLNLHDHFSAYEFFSHTETELDQTLINSGVRLQQLPPGESNELEKMMMADVFLWAMDTPPPANIVFIVGNVDLSYLFEKLRQRSYNVFLVSLSGIQLPQGMLNAANDSVEWFSFLQFVVQFPSADPGFHGHFITTEKPPLLPSYAEKNDRRSPLLPSSAEKPNRPLLLPSPAEKPNRPPLLPSPTEKPRRPPLLPSPAEKPNRPPLLPSPAEKPNWSPLRLSTTFKKNPGKNSSPSMTNVSKNSGLSRR